MDDLGYMQRAMELARLGAGWTSPNPIVGAVIVKDGRIVGEGYHRKAGTPHAEIHALRDAGSSASGATLYVNLEPCSHYGRTPPCTKAVIQAGVARVVVAMEDPNPKVAGQGIQELKRVGIQVAVGILEQEARELNEIFIKYITTRIPFVTLKIAITLDGKIATTMGKSKWITSQLARDEVHRLRHLHDAVLTGIGTVLADDPKLNVRLEGSWRDPLRVIVDSRLRLPLTATVAASARGQPTLVATTNRHDPEHKRRLEEMGIEVAVLPSFEGRVDLSSLMKLLGGREITSILLEGGGYLAAGALAQGIVDKIIAFIAPKIFGGMAAPGPVGELGVREVGQALSLTRMKATPVGSDLMVTGYLNPDVPRGTT
ncbi:MAG: bifunctional diaminohydroxyphosphoribosylaminopyrimidine deaminase/5-amino-6-(5-phosphoribosylamino)uracil reductase RibD [Bacillota bacterium]